MAESSEDQGDTKKQEDRESVPTEGSTLDDDDDEVADSEPEEDDDVDEEEEEPKLKYARMTSHLLPVYRNGDATSAFLVAGDKMVCIPRPNTLDQY